MKMALKDGQVLIVEADSTQFAIIKSWGDMKWSKPDRMFYGPAEIGLLNRLAGMVRLPAPIEAERQRMNRIQAAVDAERMKDEPEPLCRYPVRIPLFRHQIRGANMALLTFGLAEPPDSAGAKKSFQRAGKEAADG